MVVPSCENLARDLEDERRRWMAETSHRQALHAIARTGIPVVVGGAYALRHHAGIVRDTKDLDVHVRTRDCAALLARLERLGFLVEETSAHWLAKAYRGTDFVDIIFNSGNGLCPVDEAWFEHAEPGLALGLGVRFCPPEELIWSKAYIQERERYDGADIAHLVRARGTTLRWPHLLARFGPHWRVLLAHLVLFGFVYPGERDRVPAWVLRELQERLARETASPPPPSRLCRGPLLSRAQYLADVSDWGYRDARQWPSGPLHPDAASRWTAAASAPPPDRR
jgi:hypothetical protein